jgi:hypothetical protein
MFYCIDKLMCYRQAHLPMCGIGWCAAAALVCIEAYLVQYGTGWHIVARKVPEKQDVLEEFCCLERGSVSACIVISILTSSCYTWGCRAPVLASQRFWHETSSKAH